MNIQEKLLKLKGLKLPFESYMIVSSGALAIRGIREAVDLDVITTKELWDELSKKYKITINESGIERLEIDKDIEIINPNQSYFATVSGIPMEEMLSKADVFEGVKFMNLEHLKLAKMKLGREKDLKDVKLIDAYLNSQPKIYFITGVCGTGKTTALSQLKNLLPKDKYDLHDLDERGVPKGGGRTWRFEETKYLISLGKQNTEKGITTVISGFSRPSETKDLAPEQKNISFILLDADSNTIEQRILGRYPTEESKTKFTEKHGKSINQFIQENTSFAETMRKEAKEYGSNIIDTNNKTPEIIAREILAIISI